VFNILKKQLSAGLRRSMRAVASEFDIQRRHRRAVGAARHIRGPLKLNLGCGDGIKKGWVNIDLFADGADLSLDLREPLPFAGDTATVIYTEHFLEHLEFPNEVMSLLREAHRVLHSGGVLRVGVPDAGNLLIAYANGDRERFGQAWNPRYPDWLVIPMHRLNYCFRQAGEHKYAYDQEILIKALRDCGFHDVQRSEFSPLLDSEHRRDGTIYVTGVKGREV
jgi:predicted SAM-dependent methyltransferase